MFARASASGRAEKKFRNLSRRSREARRWIRNLIDNPTPLFYEP